jgi:hypothetical protein
MSDEDPLIKALPPATDYLTYLTILEYQLTPARLPLLHDILQDDKLTANIGWDLIHLLLPLLPASEACLQDVARLGNPREVILKVTESLEEIGNKEGGDAEDLENIPEEGEAEVPTKDDVVAIEDGISKVNVAETTAIGEIEDTKTSEESAQASAQLSLSAQQFNCLLSMLSTLHPRIKTKYPSRFLATSLQAILAAYSRIFSPSTTTAGLEFVRTLSGRKRPTLPPRLSSKQITKFSSDDAAPDPEGQTELPAPEEAAMQQRLLQSFLTHILEEFVGSFGQQELPGLAWTARLQEKLGSAKTIPGRKTHIKMFSEEVDLKERDVMVGQIMVCSLDL